MKVINIFLILYFTSNIVSCSSPYDVKYDYDQQTDFTALKTYDWMPIPEKATMDHLVVQRVKNAVNAELKAKGLVMTTDNPDFLIAEHLGKKDKVQLTDWGYDYRPYGGGYWGHGGISTYNYEEGTLILDFVDAKSKKLIWRGSISAEVQNIDTPEKSEKLINKAVKEILNKYPPSLLK